MHATLCTQEHAPRILILRNLVHVCVHVCVCVYLCVCGQLPELETKKEESKAKIGRQQKEFEGQDRQNDLDINDMWKVLSQLQGFEKKVVCFSDICGRRAHCVSEYTTQDTQGHMCQHTYKDTCKDTCG
jgi:hypothetical protein